MGRRGRARESGCCWRSEGRREEIRRKARGLGAAIVQVVPVGEVMGRRAGLRGNDRRSVGGKVGHWCSIEGSILVVG
jgi:hypothetical protein